MKDERKYLNTKLTFLAAVSTPGFAFCFQNQLRIGWFEQISNSIVKKNTKTGLILFQLHFPQMSPQANNSFETPCFDIEVHSAHGTKEKSTLVEVTDIGTSVINGASSPVAFTANALVILAILRTRSLRTPSNTLLCCLAVTDLSVGLILQPATIAVRTSVVAHSLCSIRITVSITEYFLTCVSFTSLSAIGIDRYLALFYPLRYESLVTTNRCIVVAIAMWLTWMVFISFRLVGLQKVFWPLLGVTWGAALLISTVVYVKIFFLIRHHRRQIRCHQPGLSSSQSTTSDNEVTLRRRSRQSKDAITMGYVIGFLFICYIPVGIILMCIYSFGETEELEAAEHWAEAFFYMSSAFNPVIYLLRSRELREAAAGLVKCC